MSAVLQLEATLGDSNLEQLIVRAEWRNKALVATFADGCRAIVPASDIGEVQPTSLHLPIRPPYGVLIRYGRRSELLPWDWLRHYGDQGFLGRTLDTRAASRTALGLRVRTLRQAAGLTQADIADSAGVSRATVSRVEGGRGGATLDSMERIAVALDVDLATLLNDSSAV